MPDYAYPNLTVHGRLVPDSMSDAERATRAADDQPVPGFEIGVEIEGVFVPIFSKRSVGGLIADIQRAAANARAQADTQPPPAPVEPVPAPVAPPPPPPVE